MLIRSQNKLLLVDMSNTLIQIEKRATPNMVGIVIYGFQNSSSDSVTLGVYDSEERAISVLNYIQDTYMESVQYDEMHGYIAQNLVYQMPEK